MTAIDQRTEWLEQRRLGLGGSDVAAVLGLSPWGSPWSVWAEKCGLTPAQDETFAMRRGRFMEPLLADEFRRQTGLWVVGEQTWLTHPQHPWARMTADGFAAESPASAIDAVLGGFEGKTTSDREWPDGPPVHYLCQAQWGMACSGLARWYFGVDHRHAFRVYVVERDDEDIARLLAVCERFWHDHVLTGIPPEVDGSDATAAAITDVWPADDGTSIEVGADAVELVKAINEAKYRVKAAEDDVARLSAALQVRMEFAAVATHGVDDRGRPVQIATWKTQTRESIDAKALRNLHPDIAATFTKTTEFRVLRTAPTKGK